jgi:hypothetical protein
VQNRPALEFETAWKWNRELLQKKIEQKGLNLQQLCGNAGTLCFLKNTVTLAPAPTEQLHVLLIRVQLGAWGVAKIDVKVLSALRRQRCNFVRFGHFVVRKMRQIWKGIRSLHAGVQGRAAAYETLGVGAHVRGINFGFLKQNEGLV